MRRGFRRLDLPTYFCAVIIGWFAIDTTVEYGASQAAPWYAMTIYLVALPTLGRLAYNAGWTAGRFAMIDSLREAGERNMSLVDWLVGEAERDGVTVTVHRDDGEQ